MAILAAFNLEAFHHDPVNAFTNSTTDETFYYSETPEGYELAGRYLLLLRALYGLRRSPLLWLKEFSGTLVELGLTQVGEDHCLFMDEWMTVFYSRRRYCHTVSDKRPSSVLSASGQSA